MPIISLSLDEDSLSELEEIEKKLGSPGRSKVMRLAIDSLRKEVSLEEGGSGASNAVVTLTYENHVGEGLKGLMGQFEGMIKTEIHQHSEGVCVRVFFVRGKAEKLRSLLRILRGKKGIRSISVNFI